MFSKFIEESYFHLIKILNINNPINKKFKINNKIDDVY